MLSHEWIDVAIIQSVPWAGSSSSLFAKPERKAARHKAERDIVYPASYVALRLNGVLVHLSSWASPDDHEFRGDRVLVALYRPLIEVETQLRRIAQP